MIYYLNADIYKPVYSIVKLKIAETHPPIKLSTLSVPLIEIPDITAMYIEGLCFPKFCGLTL